MMRSVGLKLGVAILCATTLASTEAQASTPVTYAFDVIFNPRVMDPTGQDILDFTNGVLSSGYFTFTPQIMTEGQPSGSASTAYTARPFLMVLKHNGSEFNLIDSSAPRTGGDRHGVLVQDFEIPTIFGDMFEIAGYGVPWQTGVGYFHSRLQLIPGSDLIDDTDASIANLETLWSGGRGFLQVTGYVGNSFRYSSGQITNLYRIGSVPEPTTWSMLVLGFGLVGATVRRTRSTAMADWQVPFVGVLPG